MFNLQRIFGKYTGWLRRFKAVYVINNWLNRDKLAYNKERYQALGINRSIYAPIGHNSFNKSLENIPWLDQPNALEKLGQNPSFQAANLDMKAALRKFIEEGFLLLPGFFSMNRVETLNQEVDRLLKKSQVDFNYTGRKIMDAHVYSDIVNSFFKDAELLKWLGFLLGTKPIPFQTINFIRGSEQRAHSDSIHMSTEPRGYLTAAWVALEEIGPEQGPLVYYPASHRLPYTTISDYPSGNSRYLIGAHSNKNYEDHVASLIEQHGLQARPFHAKPGDVFIWHANLLHGGSAIQRAGATRRSMVAHYFGQGAICFHEMSQRPALISSSALK